MYFLIALLKSGLRVWLFFAIAVILSSYFNSVSAQSLRIISTNDGLPQSFVSGLVQDDSSFVWIGTRNGLARFDGINFKVFQHDPNDASTIASNLIIWIRKNADNTLWFEYETGDIDRFNPVTEKVSHLLKGNLPGTIQFVRRGWMMDSDGIFWGITKGEGLNYYDPQTKSITVFNKKNSLLPSDTVRAITEIKGQGIWIVTNTSVSLLNKKTKQFTNYTIPYEQDYGIFEGSDAIAVDLHIRKNGELMWGDRRNIFFFNPSTHIFREIAAPEISYLGARWIRSDSSGTDYFENYGKVYRYENNTGITKVGRINSPDSGGVKSFLVDRSGLIWMGTNAGGIQQLDLETPMFQSFGYKKDFITDMLQYAFNKNARQFFNLTPQDLSFSAPSYHLRSAYDANKKLYIGLKETVYYYDTALKQFIQLPPVPVVAADQFGIAIKGIDFMPDGSPVVVEYTGAILVYNATLKTWQPFIDPTLLRKKFGAILLPQDIYADNENIWISTATDGLLCINIQTKVVTQFKATGRKGSLPTNELLALEPDPSRADIFWIGSYQGLVEFNKKNQVCKVFSLKEGLPDNTVYSLVTGLSGKLWFSTNKGICQFDPVSHHVKFFNKKHGLPGDEFNRFHDLALPDGRLAFGGTEGWTIFNPLSMKEDHFNPAVAFTDIKINNEDTVPENMQAALSNPLNAMQKLVLPFQQNTVSIGYAGLEFNQPTDIKYRYKLQGYDKNWIYAGNKREAVYTKLPPGNYTLFINASNTSGNWSNNVKTLAIQVDAPWWGTKLAYICYAIIVGGLVWTFVRFSINRELMKKEIDLKEKESAQLREIDDMKSKFFSNITHEFRTPLTLITGPAEQIKATATGEQQKNLANTIISNASQLLGLINRLLDLSKLEAKAFTLHEQKGNPADIIGSIVHSFENEAGKKDIQLFFEDETQHADGLFYADALERVLYNLLSNAIKFTQPGGRVNVTLALKDAMLELIVKDNGSGISKDRLPYIFERFYQADGNSAVTGTGIGLALVKELIEQAGGTTNVESNTADDDKGTIFTVVLPFKKIDDEKIIVLVDENTEMQTQEGARSLILVVEDNTELAGFIKNILSEKYRVVHVLNGEAGLEAALQQMPDVILSDLMMPVMDGYEMCRQLKEDIRTSHIPVIMLTAKVSQENIVEGLSKGADDYLAKPFHPAELSLRIHNLLERQQKLKALYQKEQYLLPGTAAFETPATPQDVFLAKLYQQMDEHIDDPAFNVDNLADVLFISRSSLHRKLKAVTGMSTTEVMRNYRLKRAAEFLKEGYSSTDAAYKSGFGSPAYFTKNFRELYGITPGEYIKKTRGQTL